MAKMAVTGGSGKAGHAVVRDLLERGHDVLNVDWVPSAESSTPDSLAPFLLADLTDFGQTLQALSGGGSLPGIEAVVHLAAIPSLVLATADLVFRTNITSTHTVFAAAAGLKLERVGWASSETTLGLPFDTPPEHAPVDEEHELGPESSYALSKVLGEEAARQFSRWTGIPHPGLRFSNIMERTITSGYRASGPTPRIRKWNLWSYVDASRVAESVRLALEADAARSGLVHYRGARHRDGHTEPGADERGLPRGAGRAGARGARNAAEHRQGPQGCSGTRRSSPGASSSEHPWRDRRAVANMLRRMSAGFVHTCIRVRDIGASVEFYRRLGFEHRGRLNFESAYNVYLGLPGGGDVLELTVNVDRDDPYDLGDGYNHTALVVDDLDGLLRQLAAAGIEPERPPYAPGGREEYRICFVADPDGYRIELIDTAFPTPQDPPHPSERP